MPPPTKKPLNLSAVPVSRTFAMPADTSPSGGIFGGWLLSQMDIAGGIVAIDATAGRVATVGVNEVNFYKPVLVGDEVSCYADVQKIGNTSIAICVEVWIKRHPKDKDQTKAADGLFTYVALDAKGKPRTIARK